MDGVYKPGAVSSLIHLETKSKSVEKSRKEQKKLDKLFGRMTTKKVSETRTNVSSDEDVSKKFINDKSKSSKKKEKIEICEEVESPKNKKKQKLEIFEESIEVDPSSLKKKKKKDVLDESEKIDLSASKKKKQKEEIFEESIEVDSSSLKKKNLEKLDKIDSSASKNKKKQKEISENSSEVNLSSLEKKKEKDIFKDVKKKKKEKKGIFEESEGADSSPKKKKMKKNISSFEEDDDGDNNKKEEKNLKTDQINHIKEKKRNNEDISNSLKKPKKFKDVISDEEKSKKGKKRKIEEFVPYSDEEADDNDDTLSERKKLKKDTEEEALPFSPKKPRQKTNPLKINDVLCAIKESDGSKSRTRTTKQQDLSDFEDEQPIQKRQKKKRDKKNDRRTVFVGNLPLTITKKKMKQMFTPCGQIENLRMRGAIPANPKLSKRYAILKKAYHPKCLSINAYVCFVDKESADKACKMMNGTIVEGQHIRVNSSIISKTAHDYKRSVFVGNLPFVISEEDVRQHFLDCGEIVDIRLVKDWKTGIGKGFGYVKFENTDSAELAIRLDNSVLKTRKIRVSPSETDPKNKRTDKGPVKKGKTKKKDKKDFVGVKAEMKKKKLKPKHLARKMGLAKTKTDMTPQKVVEKNTDGPNKHMVFQ